MTYPFQQGTSPMAYQQTPYLPAWGSPPSPTSSPNDFIDQATKILNFAEALRGREAGRQQQGTATEAPSQYSVGQFASQSPQAIAQQQQQLAQLATSTPVGSPYTQGNYSGSLAPTNNLEQRLQVVTQGMQALAQENQHCYRVIDSMMPFLQINALLNQEIEAMDKAIAALAPFVGMAEVWKRDAIAHEQVLDNICYLISDPEYLVYWAFMVWNKSIRADGGAAIEWIRDEFSNLLNTFEQKYSVSSGGQHSQLWYRQQNNAAPIMGSPDTQSFAFQAQPQFSFQSNNALPMPPVPNSGGTTGGGSVDALKQRIALMKAGVPDLAQQMQRAHVQQRQALGMGGF